MGIFSTKSFGKGSAILSSDYGPLIPIPDGNAVHDHWIGLFNNYIWGQYSGPPISCGMKRKRLQTSSLVLVRKIENEEGSYSLVYNISQLFSK